MYSTLVKFYCDATESGADLGFLERGGGLIQSTNLLVGDVLQHAKHAETRGGLGACPPRKIL